MAHQVKNKNNDTILEYGPLDKERYLRHLLYPHLPYNGNTMRNKNWNWISTPLLTVWPRKVTSSHQAQSFTYKNARNKIASWHHCNFHHRWKLENKCVITQVTMHLNSFLPKWNADWYCIFEVNFFIKAFESSM
jgi:hypothetical protein